MTQIECSSNNPFVQTFAYLFEALSVNPFPTELGYENSIYRFGLVPGLQPYLDELYTFAGQLTPTLLESEPQGSEPPGSGNNKTLIAFSGGKDSIATALLARDRGREVTLFNVQGINKVYSRESVVAQELANSLEFPLVTKRVRQTGPSDYKENPVKNGLILALMVEYGMSVGCTEYGFGDQRADKLDSANLQFNASDSIEFFDHLETFYQRYIPGYAHWFPVLHSSHAYTVLHEHGLWGKGCSCIVPDYRRPGIRSANLKKFPKVGLAPDRCGTCQKCAYEYLHGVIFGASPLEETYYRHCVDALRRTRYQDSKAVVDWNTVPENEILGCYIDFPWLLDNVKGFVFDPKTEDMFQYLRGRPR